MQADGGLGRLDKSDSQRKEILTEYIPQAAVAPDGSALAAFEWQSERPSPGADPLGAYVTAAVVPVIRIRQIALPLVR